MTKRARRISTDKIDGDDGAGHVLNGVAYPGKDAESVGLIGSVGAIGPALLGSPEMLSQPANPGLR